MRAGRAVARQVLRAARLRHREARVISSGRRPLGRDCHALPIEEAAAGSYCFIWSPGGEEQMDVVKIIFAILLPPVGVFLEVGPTGHFWLNILLTLLGYVPGLVHAVWIIARR